MKEPLEMEGNISNWLNQAFLLTYGICGLFSSILTTKISSHIVLSLLKSNGQSYVSWFITCDTYLN
ncbi:uncharacterized protein PRCAT00004982001 [Priceomyces carsonii]|uniref:uncharacterized protein n=1 Tax=Priceomyces carsonii TaxID=28549 RepID=UPI002EDBB53A|nr:unnamed protein product [Priceomyces carsonii]